MKPIRVSQLNGYIKRVLSSDPVLGNISVIGEISNLKYHGSGHVYFTLKDETGKINCFLSADAASKLRYELDDGMEIIATGYVSVYERGGYYSLNIRYAEISGAGDLAVAFKLLKDRLEKEGLFDREKKKPIPFFPERVAVVTSETGAAVRDIIKIIKSRNNYTDVLIYPVLVQGVGAAKDIAEAIRSINELFPDVDTMIVGRGGGGAEDLWAFNEEAVARAIYESKIPVISAVGHETDFTIADFVADARAETPTAAAMLAVPDIGKLKEDIDGIRETMLYYMKKAAENRAAMLETMSPSALAENLRHALDMMRLKAESCYERIAALSPLNIMERGYGAITLENGTPVTSALKLKPGDIIKITFKDGSIGAVVKDGR